MKYKGLKVCGMTLLSCVTLLTAVSASAAESTNNETDPIIEKADGSTNEVDATRDTPPISEEVTPDNSERGATAENLRTSTFTSSERTVTDVEVDANEPNDTVTEINDVTADHQWQGAVFGVSTNSKRNKVIENENGTVTLQAATYNPETKVIDGKGGKFTSYYDGISYYYTEIDAETENFDFTATFNVDYLNPNADGQEGFGIILRDVIGDKNGGDEQFVSNSAAILASRVKFNDSDGKKFDLKPGLSSRFVTGLTEDIINEGATAIAANGSSVTQPLVYNASAAIEEGKKYTFRLKKTNTGYHAIYNDGKENYENILYGVDKLLQIDNKKLYLGVAAARGVVVTVSDMKLEITDPKTDAPAIPEPIQKIDASFKLNHYNKTGNKHYNLELLSNVAGKAKVYNHQGEQIAEVDLDSNYAKFVPVELIEGDNNYTARFEIANPESVNDSKAIEAKTVINHKTYRGYYKNNIGTYLNVSPTGSSQGDGTIENPLDIFTAIDYLQPGQMIELVGGVYEMDKNITIYRGNNGTENLNKLMGTVSSEPAIFDFTKGGAFILNGNYWKLDNLHIRNTQGNIKGLTIGGSYNKVQRIEAYNNGDTGIQISGSGSEHSDFWPKYNIVENSTSYNNVDPGHNNADGFAAKITVGEGNLFRGDIAYNNVDDGWDLFAKVESGPIGIVTIEDSITYRNGTNLAGTARGDGNGFKLGGDGIAIPHVLKNSISYDNDADGVTSNSNPAVNVYNTISVLNKGTNLSLYGKGNAVITSEVDHFISWKPGKVDVHGNAEILNNPTNYMNGVNIAGEAIDDTWFEKVDISRVPLRNPDGSIHLEGLFVLTKGNLDTIRLRPIVSEVLVPYFELDEEKQEWIEVLAPAVIEDATIQEQEWVETLAPGVIEATTQKQEWIEVFNPDVIEETDRPIKEVPNAVGEMSSEDSFAVIKNLEEIEMKAAAQLPATGESQKAQGLMAIILATLGTGLVFFKRKQ